MKNNSILVNVRWFDGCLEDFEAKEE